MSFDYSRYTSRALILIAKYGLPVQFQRNGSVYAVSCAFESESEAHDASASASDLLAQTEVATKTWLVAATSQAVRVGDYAIRDGKTCIVQKVSEFRPGATLIYQVIEVQ